VELIQFIVSFRFAGDVQYITHQTAAISVENDMSTSFAFLISAQGELITDFLNTFIPVEVEFPALSAKSRFTRLFHPFKFKADDQLRRFQFKELPFMATVQTPEYTSFVVQVRIKVPQVTSIEL
jgi:hypothetical protein